MGFDAFGPVVEEASDFADGAFGEAEADVVAPPGEDGGGVAPGNEEGIDAQGGAEPFIAREAFFPNRPFYVVEWGIGHADPVHATQLHATGDVVLDFPLGEPLANRAQIALLHIQAE